MREILRRKVKQNSAFTMAEMLVVVAITVVLLGISMLAISNLVTSLKMKELDDYAKTIYLEAQNQLIAEKIEGGLPKFQDEIHENYARRFLTAIPQDYKYEDDGWRQLCYLTKGDEIAEEFLPESSYVYQMEGNYLIELNPETGDVYGVFYSEKDESISYNTITELADRTQEERTELKLGYYGGIIDRTMNAGIALDQQVELINEEELYLKVSFDKSSRLLKYYTSSLKVDFSISDEHENTWNGYLDLTNAVETMERIEFYMLLDSMEAEHGFSQIAAESQLVPGDNLTIVVQSVYQHGSDFCIETNEDNPCIGNSLFGNETDNAFIEVRNLRHLRNLDENYYTHEAVENVTICISEDIDFNSNNYAWNYANGSSGYVGAGLSQSPMAEWEPVENDSLMAGSTVTVSEEGVTHKLSNFVIKAKGNNAGVFATANNVAFSNITLEDITVNAAGYSNVGTLVGSMTGGSITNCGVYLSTYSEIDGIRTYYSQVAATEGDYKNEMERRYASLTVTGADYVGGLVGSAAGVQIADSFAAIQVIGSGNYVGGLIGQTAYNTTRNYITNAYASGNVTGNNYVGGLIGKATYVDISNVYTTGSVYGNYALGGFCGASSNGAYNNCSAYSEVYTQGTNLLEGIHAGGFVADSESQLDSFTNCNYLVQTGYNAVGLESEKPANVGIKNYMEFATASEQLAAGSTFPYDKALWNQQFPFALSGQKQHYGNWPQQFIIDTSLVYYEKYADGLYGYYAITTLSGKEENVWLLDTLRDEECVEDGYALLTKFNLTQFDYELYVGSGTTATIDSKVDSTILTEEDESSAETIPAGSVTVVDVKHAISGADKYKNAFRLVQQGELVFDAYTRAEDGTLTKANDQFSVNGLYLYQLPYGLQCTYRYQIDNFYDRLIIKDAKAKGSDTVVIDEMPFFYSPHFAKTAVNPNASGIASSETIIEDTPTMVYVRSARQLNALGRFPYYWNARGGNNTKINFVQESDINFSSYTGGAKMYCGQEFDLLAFGKDYSNRPIGEPDRSDKNMDYAQFGNNYNGQSYQIIDYCLNSSNQFVGMFGEILDAKIENVVMTVSGKAAEGYTDGSAGDVANATNAGKIISHHNGLGDDSGRAGTGALIGLAYMKDNDKDGYLTNTINNCASAGYYVELQYGEEQIERLAIGGLVGFSMSSITNCSATNDVRINLLVYNPDDLTSVFMAGLSGSFLYGTLQNCYSGGTIDIIASDEQGRYKIHHLTVGGITAGGLYIRNDYSNTPIYSQRKINTASSSTSWNNLYTYTRILNQYRDSDGTKITKLFSAYTRYYRDPDAIDWWRIYDEAVISEDGTDCYYLDSAYEDVTIITDAYFTFYAADKGLDHSTKLDYAGLSNLKSGNLTKRVSKDCTYPTSSNLRHMVYPFPTVVTNVRTEKNVHYGDWPIEQENIEVNYPAYYEIYERDAAGNVVDAGVYYMKPDGTTVNHLVQDDSKEILETGYALMSVDKTDDYVLTWDIQHVAGGQNYTYYLTEYAVNCASNGKYTERISFPYETAVMTNGTKTNVTTEVKNVYVNGNFAAAISLDANGLGTTENYLQVRTEDQLSNVNNILGNNIHMKLTHSISLTENYVPVSVKETQVFNGNALEGFAIRNAPTAVFDMNKGIIMNTLVMDSNIECDDNTAIFANTNNGMIETSNVINGKLTTTAEAAGFVNHNVGTVTNCGIRADESYENLAITGYQAYGFVGDNEGTISNSYVVGTVNAISEAAGFAASNTGSITLSYANTKVRATAAMAEAAGFVLDSYTLPENMQYSYASGAVEAYAVYGFMKEGNASWCYTISEVVGSVEKGFAADDAQVNNCYWGYDEKSGFNMSLYDKTQVAGIAISLGDLMRTDYDFVINELEDEPYTDYLGNDYPYPSTGLPHYGDWQPPSVANQNDTIANQWFENYGRQPAGVFYYERYMDGSYGVYAVGVALNGNYRGEAINTLASADEPVITSGYGVFYQDTRWDIDILGDWQDKKDITDYEDNILEGFEIAGLEKYKFCRIMESEALDMFACTMYHWSNDNDGNTLILYESWFDRPESE